MQAHQQKLIAEAGLEAVPLHRSYCKRWNGTLWLVQQVCHAGLASGWTANPVHINVGLVPMWLSSPFSSLPSSSLNIVDLRKQRSQQVIAPH